MMSNDMEVLTIKLDELNINLQLIKKMLNRDDCKLSVENDKPKLDKTFQKISGLTKEIQEKFEKKFNKNQQLKGQKLQKDFNLKMQSYRKMLAEYRDNKDEQLRNLRKSVQYTTNPTKTGKSKGKKTNYSSDEQSEGNKKQIQLQVVNQETLFQQHMIQLKEKQLLEIKQKMDEALKVQKQVGKLVHQQGQQLDIIEDNVDSARSNVKEGADLLEEGVRQHVSANRKKFCIMGIVFIVLLIIIIPILIKVI